MATGLTVVRLAETDEEIARAFPAMHQLRPHLEEAEFVPRVRRMQKSARAAGCQSFELDSGVQRFDAHRFYLTNRMQIPSHHFRLSL